MKHTRRKTSRLGEYIGWTMVSIGDDKMNFKVACVASSTESVVGELFTKFIVSVSNAESVSTVSGMVTSPVHHLVAVRATQRGNGVRVDGDN